VKLAQRVAVALGMAMDHGQLAPGSTLRVGYDAVANLTYSPIDPFELLTRAAAAVRSGIPEAACPWVRRLAAAKVEDREAPERISDKRRTIS
jgi:hypothetical protein